MLDLHSWSTSAVIAFFSVSAALGADPNSFASQPAEEPVEEKITVQLEYEPAAEVRVEEDPSLKSCPAHAEPVKDTDPAWMTEIKADKELLAMAMCESGLDPGAIGHGDSEITGHPSYGLFQFQPGTFEGYVREHNLLNEVPDDRLHEHIFDPYIQLELVKLMLADGGGRHWYTCYYKKYGTGAHRATS
jgi:hypothetical protein